MRRVTTIRNEKAKRAAPCPSLPDPFYHSAYSASLRFFLLAATGPGRALRRQRPLGQPEHRVPCGARDALRIREYVLHRPEEPVQVLLRDRDRREELDHFGVEAGDLRQDAVFLEQGDND